MVFGYNKIVVVAMVCLFHLTSATDEKVKETMVKMAKECQEKTGASDADMDALRARKLPESKEGICMFECFFENAKIMVDGKYDKAGFIKALTPLMEGDDEKIAKLKEMATVCGKELGTGDKCEVAHNLMKCTVEKGKAFGFQYPNDF